MRVLEWTRGPFAQAFIVMLSKFFPHDSNESIVFQSMHHKSRNPAAATANTLLTALLGRVWARKNPFFMM